MFNEKQKKAIANLEKAFKVCAELDLYFAGCDNALLVSTYNFDNDRFYLQLTDIPYEIVETYGAYADSGGA